MYKRQELLDRVRTNWHDIAGTLRVARNLPKLVPQGHWNVARMIEGHAKRMPNGMALAYEQRRWTWREMDERANQYADFFVKHGIGRGDVVALVMDNRPDYLFCLAGLSKIRAVGALINHNLVGKALVHAINVSKPKAAVVGSEHLKTFGEVLPDLEGLSKDRNIWVQADNPDVPPNGGYEVLNDEVAAAPRVALRRWPEPSTAEPMCYIYTSGTTGLPKAAIITNQRWLVAAAFFGNALGEATPADVIYMTLPLYHSTGQFAGWGASIMTGATLALRRK